MECPKASINFQYPSIWLPRAGTLIIHPIICLTVYPKVTAVIIGFLELLIIFYYEFLIRN